MDLIRSTLVKLEERMNEFFRNQAVYLADEKHEWVTLSNVVDHKGSTYDGARNKVVMFLANIQHEVSVSTFSRTKPIRQNDSPADAAPYYTAITPPLYINLYLLFIANFKDDKYKDGLSAISTTISFFQQHPVFTHQNLPNLDTQIDKLTFEMVNLDLVQLNYLMGLSGTKYLPSAYFKVRMLPFQSDVVQEMVPGLRGLKAPADLEDTVIPTPSPFGALVKDSVPTGAGTKVQNAPITTSDSPDEAS